MRHDSAKRSESVLNHRQRRLTSTHLCQRLRLPYIAHRFIAAGSVKQL
jgi:hypothetical protein